MALEIRELIIRSTVAAESGANQGASGESSGATGGNAALINQVVDKVLEILREKMER